MPEKKTDIGLSIAIRAPTPYRNGTSQIKDDALDGSADRAGLGPGKTDSAKNAWRLEKLWRGRVPAVFRGSWFTLPGLILERSAR